MDKITDPAAVRTQERADRYKLQLIAQAYRQNLPQDLARDLAWVRDRKTELVVQTKAGARIHDDGKMLSLDGRRDPAAVRLAVQMARAKGWNSIELNGSNQFRLAAAEAATRAGIKVTNAELRQHVQQIRERMAEEARPKLGVRKDQLTWLREHVAAIKARQAEIQPKLPTPTWTAPDGQVRPLYVTRNAGGLPVRVKDKPTDAEIRAQLQPTWEQAKARLQLAEQKVEDMTVAFKSAGWFDQLRMSVTERAKAKKLDTAVTEAQKTVQTLDRQWESGAMSAQRREFERAIAKAWNEGEEEHEDLAKETDKLGGALNVPARLIATLERLEHAGIQLDPPMADDTPDHGLNHKAAEHVKKLEEAINAAEQSTRAITEKWEAEQLADSQDSLRRNRLGR